MKIKPGLLTLTLLAGIDLQTGMAIPHVHEKHNSSVFIEWLEKVDAMYPEGDKIRLISDNLSVHTSAQVKAYFGVVGMVIYGDRGCRLARLRPYSINI